MKVREDRLNEHFSQSDFKLDQGEALLKEMQQLRDELSQYEDEVIAVPILVSIVVSSLQCRLITFNLIR